MSFMCSRERGGLWCIKNHLREGQTKTVTRKCEFVPGILFVCAALSRHFQDMWVSVRIRSIRRTMQMIYLERSLAFSSSSSSSSFLYFCYFSFFSTSSSLLSCLHFWEFIQRWMLDKKEKEKVSFPLQKIIYSLYLSKILTPTMTQYPRAANCCIRQSRFHHPSCFLERHSKCWKDCGFKTWLHAVSALLLCIIIILVFVLYS